MAVNPTITLTVLDFPVIMELMRVLVERVPAEERQAFVDQWEAIVARAKATSRGN